MPETTFATISNSLGHSSLSLPASILAILFGIPIHIPWLLLHLISFWHRFYFYFHYCHSPARNRAIYISWPVARASVALKEPFRSGEPTKSCLPLFDDSVHRIRNCVRDRGIFIFYPRKNAYNGLTLPFPSSLLRLCITSSIFFCWNIYIYIYISMHFS